jgi:hypothetical protein
MISFPKDPVLLIHKPGGSARSYARWRERAGRKFGTADEWFNLIQCCCSISDGLMLGRQQLAKQAAATHFGMHVEIAVEWAAPANAIAASMVPPDDLASHRQLGEDEVVKMTTASGSVKLTWSNGELLWAQK